MNLPAQRVDADGRAHVDQRAVFALALPLMANSAVQIVLSLTDMWFIGRISTPALAAVGIAFAYGPGIDPAWELSASCAVSDRIVLLTRAVAVFALNAVLGLLASAASGAAAALTFGWMLPMTAVSALALAVAVAARSAVVGAGATPVSLALGPSPKLHVADV